MTHTPSRSTLSLLTLAVALLLGSPGCGGGDGAAGGGGAGDGGAAGPAADTGPQLSVYTSCFPVDFFTRRIAGSHAVVHHILPVGEDPPEWMPSAEIVSKMQSADLIVINGAGFEGWVKTTTLPDGKVADSTAAVGDQLITLESSTHSHGRDGEHTHAGIDPHTWSDPMIAAAQVDAIAEALAAAAPDHADHFRGNAKTLRGDLELLDATLKDALAGYDQQPLATSHPAFNYLGRRYGLVLHDFGFEPDTLPSDEAFAAFTHAKQHHGFRTMLWEAEPTDEVRAKFEGAGVQVVYLDPLEQPLGDAPYGYLKQAQDNAARLQALFPAAAPTGDEAATSGAGGTAEGTPAPATAPDAG